MGFGKSLGRGLAAFSTGGLSELAGGLGKKSTQSQVPLETPEQAAARRKLLDFANSGVFGDFKAGADVGIGYGDYDPTDIEQQGLGGLRSLLSSGIPEQFRMGDDALRGILDGSQAGIDAQFNPFKDQVMRQTRDASNAVKRNSAFAGNLYSTNTIRNLGDVEARGNETLASQLAGLTNEALNRRLQAVPLAYQSGAAQEDLQMGRINASQQFGGLTRNLNNARVAERNAEILRRRQELQLPINAATTVSGQTANFGVPSVTTNQPSELMQLLGIFGPTAGSFFGARGAG